MDNTLNVAYYIVSKYGNVTHLKLQKLLYYLKVWGVVAGENLVDGKFKKWSYGPVNPDVYDAFKKFENQVITPESQPSAAPPFAGEQKILADFILDCYAQYSAVTLSAMSHFDEPWISAGKNETISESSIKLYNGKLPFAQNFPFDPEKKPFYPVLTDTHYAYIFDMTAKDAKAAQVYPSYKVYKAKQETAAKELQKLLKSLERK